MKKVIDNFMKGVYECFVIIQPLCIYLILILVFKEFVEPFPILLNISVIGGIFFGLMATLYKIRKEVKMNKVHNKGQITLLDARNGSFNTY